MPLTNSDFVLGIIAVLFPPFAVWVKSGFCSADSLINIALCCLGYLPGLLHAWYIIIKAAEERDDPYRDVESSASEQHSGYQRIAQFDYTYQTSGVREGPVDNPTYTEVVAGSSSQPKVAAASGAPPSYSAIVKGDHKVQT